MTAKLFRDLFVWQKSFGLVVLLYSRTNSFPKNELYGLVQQIRRAAVSIPSNIAEGFKRYHNKEYRQFLYIAMGSSEELETQIRLSEELGYITSSVAAKILETLDHINRMLTNLSRKL